MVTLVATTDVTTTMAGDTGPKQTEVTCQLWDIKISGMEITERVKAGEAVPGPIGVTCQLWEIKISEMEIGERARAGKAEIMTARKAGGECGAERKIEAEEAKRVVRTGEHESVARP